MIEIRPYEKTDLPYLYEISWQTGLNGKSVEGLIDDKYKVGHYYAAPYVLFDPECCHVVTEGGLPKGYVLGTSDTVKYTGWLNTHWLPMVRKLYDTAQEASNPFARHINECITEDTAIDKALLEYPAHLHINLLPEMQGKGLGRKLMEAFFKTCRRKGAEGLHLGVSKENPGALAFYRKAGMFVLYENDVVHMMGIHLTALSL